MENKLQLLTYYDMCNLPEPEWLVEGLIQKRSTALMFGKSNTFKSFLAIDIGLSVDTGQDWCNNPVSPGGVLFVATEGGNGVGRLRVPGWYQHHRIDEADRHAFLYKNEIRLDVADDVTALINRLKDDFFALVVIDIFGGSMAGSEIEDKTARAWVSNVQRILRETGTSVLVVAHAPYQDDSRIRGHSHFWGSFDTRLRVEGDKDAMTATLTVERHKDADSNGSWGFRLEQSHGTLVPVLDETVAKKGANSKKALSGKNRTALIALDEAIQEHGVTRFGTDWPPCKVVQLDQWRKRFYLHSLGSTPAAKLKAFQRAQDKLEDEGYVRRFDDHVWLCFEGAAEGRT